MWFKSRYNNPKINSSEFYQELDKVKESLIYEFVEIDGLDDYELKHQMDVFKYNMDKKFEHLQEKLYSVKYTANLITEEWWNYLSEHWKRTVVFNSLSFYEKDGIFGLDELSSKDLLFENVIHDVSKIREFIFTPDSKYDLIPLYPLTGIETLEIRDNDKDLKPLKNLPNLMTLGLMRNKAELSVLPELEDVYTLKLSFNSKDLEHVSEMKYLSKLSLEYNSADLTPLAKSKSLKTLEIEDNKSDLSPIRLMVELRSLSLSTWSNYGVDLHFISDLKFLSSLRLSHCDSDLSPIYELKHLKELSLHLCNVDKSCSKFQEFISSIKKNGGRVYV